MAGFYPWMIDKLRQRRLAVGTRTKMLAFGAIYHGPYRNWKHDPQPLIWCQYSDAKFTHGINIHYLNVADKTWLGRTIYILKKAGQNMDGLTFFKLMKTQRPNIIKTAYRLYHTEMLNMKLVSAGITALDSLAYTDFKDPYIVQLNKIIAPSEMKRPPIQIAYSAEELRERVIEVSNAVNITKQRVATPATPQVGSFGVAPYVRGK